MNDIKKLAVVLLLLCADIACTEQEADITPQVRLSTSDQSWRQWKLPNRLNEISGLAFTSDDRLLAVNDEEAIVYEIDYDSGRLVKQFALGKPVLRGDFEGIAYFEGRVFLVTSDGLLFKANEGADGEQVRFQKFDTGIGKECELEGLAQDVERRRLLLICKNMADNDVALTVFVWLLDDDRIDGDQQFELPVSDIMMRLKTKSLHPSGIAIHPSTGSLLIVAARQRAVVELNQDGSLIDVIITPSGKRHRQPEGIEISRTGKLIIADEGGNSRARLTVYSSVGRVDND